MLTESFITSIQVSTNNKQPPPSSLKDVGIHLHEYQPRPCLRAGFKKSSTRPNGLAVTSSHIFAAQSEKSVVHVYNRDKINQEATIPFPDKVHSVAVASQDGGGVLVLGTEAGRLILWEICTGRSITTTASHLQPTTCLAVEGSSNLILSGSGDSNIHVWSLPNLLSFSRPSSTSSNEPPPNSPIQTLSHHRAAITAIALGHSSTRTNIAISASRDQSALVWDYHTGTLLRTFLLPSTPLCLTVDPADRAFYTGYEDGSVQLIDFFSRPALNNTIYYSAQQSAPTQPPIKCRWTPPSTGTGAAQCLTLSYDGTALLSGHVSGKVLSWDVAKGRFLSSIADLLHPVTNLHMLPPTGRLNEKQPLLKVHTVVKPRPEVPRQSMTGLHAVPPNYSFQAQIATPITKGPDSEFRTALHHPSFPTSLLDASLAELSSWNSAIQLAQAPPSSSFHPEAPPPATDTASTAKITTLTSQLSTLRAQLASREAAQLKTERKRRELTRARQIRKAERARKRREVWHAAEAEKRGSGDRAMEGQIVEDGGDTSDSEDDGNDDVGDEGDDNEEDDE